MHKIATHVPALALLVCAGGAMATTTLSTLVVRGEQAPGAPAGVTMSLNTAADALNSAAPGALAQGAGFFTVLSGPGLTVANDTAWFVEDQQGPRLIAREGDAVPGAPAGTNYSTLCNWGARADKLALVTLLNGPAILTNNEAVLAGNLPATGPADLRIVAQKSGTAPGVPASATFSDFVDATLNLAPDGAVAFYATLFGPGVVGGSAPNNAGIWTYETTPASGQLVARLGDQAPGMPAGAQFTTFVDPSLGSVAFQLTSGRRVLFNGGVSGGGTTFLDNSGLFFGASGSLGLIARKGDVAPGYPGRTMLGFTGYACAGDNVLWRAMLSGFGPGGNVLYRGPQNIAVKLLAKEDPAPGVPGALFNDVSANQFVRPRLNTDGQAAIPGTLVIAGSVSSGSNEALWFAQSPALGGQVTLVAREGDPVPGEAGTVYGGPNGLLTGLAINDAGTIAFRASVLGPVITGGSDEVIARWSAAEGTRIVARWGQTVTLEDGVPRTISGFETLLNAGSADGRAMGLRDDGSLVFKANFTDGTARILLATPGPVACGASDIAGPGQSEGPDGQLTADDIIVYIGRFFAADARADIAGPGQSEGADGQFSADDLIVFINRFFAGC